MRRQSIGSVARRSERQVLDWNTLAREFYHRRQATWMKGWLVYRITY